MPITKEDKIVINYSLCWEDENVLMKALNISSDDDVLSITSGGDNVLALLLQNPKSLTSVDINPTQNYLLELKIAAIRGLSFEDFLSFLGVEKSKYRIEQFQKIKNFVSPAARIWWDQRLDLIDHGIIHIGRFESYLKLFRTFVLPLIHSRSTIRKFFELGSLEEQKRFYNETWNNWRLRLLCRMFFSQAVMSRLGRSKQMFKHASVDNLGEHYLKKSKYVLTELPIKNNYLFSYIMQGNYSNKESMPSYLQESNFPAIKNAVSKIKIITMELKHFLSRSADNSFSKFNLSDIFESMSLEETEALFKELVRIGKKNSAIVFWNNLVPRKHPASLDAQIVSDIFTAKQLQKIDRAFLYNDFHVERIINKIHE